MALEKGLRGDRARGFGANPGFLAESASQDGRRPRGPAALIQVIAASGTAA